MRLVRFLNVGGAISCSLGALLALLGYAKGRQAKQLRGVTTLESLTELKAILAVVPLLVAVTGRVFANKPIKCDLSNNEGAIVALHDESHSQTRGADSTVWMPELQPIRDTVRVAEWGLSEGRGPFTWQLPVLDGSRAKSDVMQLSADQFYPADSGLVETIVQTLAGHRSVGLRRVEQFLPIGAEITAIGELRAVSDFPGNPFKGVVKTRGGKLLVLARPAKGGPFMLSRRRLPELIASTEGAGVLCNQLAAGFVIVGAGMLLAAAYHRHWVKKRVQAARRRSEEARRRQHAAEAGREGAAGVAGDGVNDEGEGAGGDEGRGICVVCYERQSGMVFPGCGHLCVCSICGEGGPGMDRCPICRSRGRPIKVYVT